MEASDIRDSPYITSWGLVPPSPTRSVDFDDTPPFDASFGITDSNIQGGNPLTYPNTPSYNGSYYNSPFSQNSELVELDIFQDLPSASTATTGVTDYEPSEYDAPNQSSSLLMFPSDPDFMSPHFSPRNIGADGQRTRGSPFDHGSPGSSPGLDDNNQGGRHSRASSVASNQQSPSAQQQQHGTHSPQPAFHSSPRLDVVNSFGNMSVHTPNWGTHPLPHSHSPHIGTESLPQQQKPQSPPRLTMPPGMTFSEPTVVPKINAPDSKDENSLMFNIVPATPVGGGDAGARQHIPFHQTLATLSQGVQLAASEGDITSQQYQQQTQQHPSPFASPHVVPNELSGDYLFPDPSGIRQGNSEGWQDGSFVDNSQIQLRSSEGAFGLLQQPVSQNVDEQHRQQLQTFTFGGNPGGDSMRRSVSDSLTATRNHRQSRSEDIRPIPTFANPALAGYHGQSNSVSGTGPQYLFMPGTDFIQRQQQGQFLHPNDLPSSTPTPGLQPQGRRSLSPMGHIRRASSGSRSGRGAEVWGTQADQLAPHANTLTVRRMSPYPTPNASPRVNYSELDELNDLGIMGTSTGGNNLGMSSGLGLSVGVSSVGVDGVVGIGEPPVSAGYTEEVAITGRHTFARDEASGQGMGHHREGSVASINAADSGINQGPVAKQNVTTGRTANASIKRRKQEATFACPVPGCGSTFTRGFNLKGHMRSHYEQKPYKCHWPGCDKGFARQHDCKRHEQLHSNYRPFVCDGCGKNFARMDALNRHLRSEAGAECAKVAGEKKEGQGDEMDDVKKPLMDSPPPTVFPQPRRRNSGIGNPGGGMLGLPDEMWSVSV